MTSVAPVTLGSARGPARVIGAGLQFAPGTGHSEAAMLGGGLRQATLKQISDAACARAFAHSRPGTGERFNAPRMLCGIDEDGKAPLSSGCFGDSGGPFIQDRVLIGVVRLGWRSLRRRPLTERVRRSGSLPRVHHERRSALEVVSSRLCRASAS